MNLVTAIILGSLLGAAFYWTGIYHPDKILNMLKLESLSLMKIILFAVGFSSFLLAGAHFLGIFEVSHLSIKSIHVGVVVGGLIFGLGLGWGGTCPGAFMAALGTERIKRAILVLMGGLVGAFLFSITYSWWEAIGFFRILSLGELTIFKVSPEIQSVLEFGYEGLLMLGVLFMIIALILPDRGTER